MRAATTSTRIAWAVLAFLVLAALLAGWLAPHPYALQSRELIGSAPSPQFPLGTDALGRDRLSRLLYGSRISLLVGPLAALLTTCLAGLFGGLAGYWGGWCERMFLLRPISCCPCRGCFCCSRSGRVLPLEVPPEISLLIVFLLLGLLGWAGPSRIVRASVRAFMGSGFVLQARAWGLGAGGQILLRHLLPERLARPYRPIPARGAAVRAERSQSRAPGIRRHRAVAFLGRPAERNGKLSGRRRPSVADGAVLLLVLVVSCLQILARRQEADSH